jgi:hypothetical protein
MDEYYAGDYLEFIRQQAAERNRRRQELFKSESKKKPVPKRDKDLDGKSKCKKCNWPTLDKTGICFRCKQHPSKRGKRREKCQRCGDCYVIRPRLLCRSCRLPQIKKEQDLQIMKDKIASGRCAAKGCQSKAMPKSKTCIRH